MAFSRRNFLKGAAAGSAAAACAAATTTPAEARENLTMPPKAVGLLYDSTICVGCKACVVACRDANDTHPEFSTEEKLWDNPLDISGKTITVIKMYSEGTGQHKDQEKDGFAFMKRSCLHCVDPSCVSVCPVTAMTKDPVTGIVSHEPADCIGCRYCIVACPFAVPQFEFDKAFPKLLKCQLCKHRQAEGKIPACAEVCPTGATLFGPVTALKEEADRRLAVPAGKPNTFARKTVGSPDVHEHPNAAYVQHAYGTTEMGGTQMLLLSGVPFEKMGYPKLRERSYASEAETIQEGIYHDLIAPVALFAGLLYVARKNTKNHDEEE
ncbi:hydrogenase 2 operon protein HybA [Telmatospirillum siberiense]|uniref:Hydrogenase 2 protein HybA n=1 Tax=Telmatospirillum siberiense TaxID=382514 RepID=A0A2N3PRT3_9PROT|nr:hydrogenase 2 operon protein HybA [Telmatospirillum siberiense]PKU23108.1 hydrogenase 2 protein HybA [Telmatospirillum siberiense]